MNTIRNTLIVIVVLNIVLIGGLWFGYQSMSDRKTAYEQLTGDIAKEESATRSAASLRRVLEGIAPARAKLDEFFFEHTDDDGVRFVEEIEDLAKISGVDLQVSGASFSGTPPDTIFHMNTHVGGTWTEVNRFMNLLEEFPAHVSVTRWSFQLEGGAKDLTSTHWSGVVDFDLISIKEPAIQQHAGN